MTTDSRAAVTDGVRMLDSQRIKLCTHCNEQVNWMLTRYGSREPFDTTLLPAEYGTTGVGWIPGLWPIAGTYRLVMAPAEHYPRLKRDRVTHVATRHQCTRTRRAAA